VKRRIALITMPLLALAVFTLLLAGCGGGSSSSSGTPPIQTAPALNGNWEIQATSQVTASTSYLIGGSFATTGTAVTGILHFLNYSCYYVPAKNSEWKVPVTGTVSSSGSLSLTSTVVDEQTLKVSGTVANGRITNGTYSVTGGCGNGEHGTLTGFSVSSFTGTYSGGIVSNGVSWGTMTLNLTQAAAPDSDGLYDLSGTASVVNSGLWIWTDNPAELAQATAWGGYIQGTVLTGNGAIGFNGTITDATGDTISCEFSVTGGTLTPGTGTFTLTRSK